MKKQNSDEKFIWAVFHIALFATLFAIIAIFWHLIYKAMPLSEYGYDHLADIAAGAIILHFLYYKFPFVRPSFKNMAPLLIFFRLSDYLAALIALNFAASLIMHGLLMEGPAKMIGQEFIWLGVFSLYVILTEFIFIPTAERHRKIMQADK